jgi:putative oxidoreductase
MDMRRTNKKALVTGSTAGSGRCDPLHPVIPGASDTTIEHKLWAEDTARLLLRLAVGGLMLFHGVHKVRHGVDWMCPLLEARGLPTFMTYGSYLGEVAAPLLILAGGLTRLASLTVAGTMVMAVFLALSSQVFALNQSGGWALELNAFFFLGALALTLLGPGRLSVWQGRSWWLK